MNFFIDQVTEAMTQIWRKKVYIPHNHEELISQHTVANLSKITRKDDH